MTMRTLQSAYKAPTPDRRTFVAASVGSALLATSALIGCTNEKPQFAGIDITGATYAGGFSLKDVSGKVRSLSEFKGKWVVVFFGFVQCPDVCPTTMAELADVKKRLGVDGDKLQTVFITVDPQRDTPDVLRAYMANFDTTAVALIPTADELSALAKEFKVYYKKVDGPTPTSYSMEHTANGYVFDKSGRIRLVARYGMGPEALTKDLRQLG